jgi:hypothetical protein
MSRKFESLYLGTYLSTFAVNGNKIAFIRELGVILSDAIKTDMETVNKIITDRIESRKIDKAKKIMLFCGIGLILISVIKFFTGTSSQITGLGWWFDTLLLVTLPVYFLLKNQKQLTNRSGQFIEWTTDTIVFKLKNETLPKTIQRNLVDSVNIHLDTIEVIDKTNQKFLLDISDFDKYEDRLKIKDNFEKEKNYA